MEGTATHVGSTEETASVLVLSIDRLVCVTCWTTTVALGSLGLGPGRAADGVGLVGGVAGFRYGDLVGVRAGGASMIFR